MCIHSFFSNKDHSVTDLREGPSAPRTPSFLILDKKEVITEGPEKPAAQAKQYRLSLLPQGLDATLPLVQRRLHK